MCEPLQSTEHGVYDDELCTTSQRKYDHNCTLTCESGYEPEQESQVMAFRCQIDKSWSATPPDKCVGA